MDHAAVRCVNPLEISDWDTRLKDFADATFFHSAAWARVLHQTYGYLPVYFVAGERDRFQSVLPVMEVNSWLTGRRGVSLPFTDECTALGTNPAAIHRLFAAAQNHAKIRQWKYLEYRGDRALPGEAPASTFFYSHSLELQRDERALFSKFDSSVRRAVRKAEQSDLTVEFAQSPEAIRDFFDLFCLTRQRHGVPPQPFSFFANIQRHVLAQNQGWIVLARHGKIPVAGAIFLHFRKSVLYKFGASNEAYQHLRANNLVMWEAIRRYSREGYTIFDFGRTDLGHEGLRKFKLGWGTQERSLKYVSYEPDSDSFAVNRDRRSDLLNRIFRSTPLFLSRLIGFLLYKHIAVIFLTFDWIGLHNNA